MSSDSRFAEVEEQADDVPSPPAIAASTLPPSLQRLTDRARDYVDAASSANTRRAYAADWKHFAAWCRRHGFELLPPRAVDRRALCHGLCVWHSDAEWPAKLRLNHRAPAVGAGLELRPAWLAAGSRRPPHRNRHGGHPQYPRRAATPEGGGAPRRYDRHAGDARSRLATRLARSRHAADRFCRRAAPLGNRRLDLNRDETEDGRGWVELLDKGIIVTLRGKTGWREVEIGRGSSDATCPVVALQTWLKLARIGHGPLFRRVTGQGKEVGADRLNDREIARLVKRAALAAGIRGDLVEGERGARFAGHSLRAGLATSAEVDERYVQKQLGHVSAEQTRRYQRRRDRFRINLTKAAGL